jgi:alkanesulfonate monooxygenase SsuD/methylene tetrahydromethanopterin reductase-like flavin-dependent oxidoreductase (luciferase family)
MRFGLFFQVPESAGQPHAARYAEMFELIELAESLGFDVAWLAELHFGGAFSLLSNPLLVVPVIAARTRRIRIGTAVTLLPLHHPLSCAEQAATADLLSGGRLEFGVGRGSIPTQFHGFRIPVAENRARFDEALAIIRLAWTQDRFSYRGAFWDVDNLEVVPKPLQRPHPPIRVGVHTPESFAHIGDLGLPIYSGTTTTPLPQLRECMAHYRRHLAAAGQPWRDDQMALMFPMHVDTSGAAARAAMRPGVHQYYRNVQAIFSQLPDSYGEHLPRLRMIEETVANLPYEKFCCDQAMFGDAAEVVDRLQAARDEFGLSQIIGWFD